MENIFIGANKNDVIDDGTDNLATTAGEVEDQSCCGFSGFNSLTLTHGELLERVVLLTFSKTKKFPNFWIVEKLIVVGGEVEGGEMSSMKNKLGDVLLGWELQLAESTLGKLVVEFVGELDGAEAAFVKFKNGEKTTVTSNFFLGNLFDTVDLLHGVDLGQGNLSRRSTFVSAGGKTFFVEIDVDKVSLIEQPVLKRLGVCDEKSFKSTGVDGRNVLGMNRELANFSGGGHDEGGLVVVEGESGRRRYKRFLGMLRSGSIRRRIDDGRDGSADDDFGSRRELLRRWILGECNSIWKDIGPTRGAYS